MVMSRPIIIIYIYGRLETKKRSFYAIKYFLNLI